MVYLLLKYYKITEAVEALLKFDRQTPMQARDGSCLWDMYMSLCLSLSVATNWSTFKKATPRKNRDRKQNDKKHVVSYE